MTAKGRRRLWLWVIAPRGALVCRVIDFLVRDRGCVHCSCGEPLMLRFGQQGTPGVRWNEKCIIHV
jgi:hypothetical protein